MSVSIEVEFSPKGLVARIWHWDLGGTWKFRFDPDKGLLCYRKDQRIRAQMKQVEWQTVPPEVQTRLRETLGNVGPAAQAALRQVAE